MNVRYDEFMTDSKVMIQEEIVKEDHLEEVIVDLGVADGSVVLLFRTKKLVPTLVVVREEEIMPLLVILMIYGMIPLLLLVPRRISLHLVDHWKMIYPRVKVACLEHLIWAI